MKTIGAALLLSFVAMLPFLHDVLTEMNTGTYSWVPNFGIEEKLTYINEVGKKKVNGYSSYRTFLYFLFLHIFAAVGWAGWAKDARSGKPYKFFLLVPACLAIYTCLVIVFNFKETSFNEATTKIFLIIVVNFLLMSYFLFRYFKSQN